MNRSCGLASVQVSLTPFEKFAKDKQINGSVCRVAPTTKNPIELWVGRVTLKIPILHSKANAAFPFQTENVFKVVLICVFIVSVVCDRKVQPQKKVILWLNEEHFNHTEGFNKKFSIENA